MTMPNPPMFPQALLGVLVRADTRDAVCGDLLEEYRESRIPALGKFRADVWYWRQVLGIWLRAYWWLVVPGILVLIVGDIFNTFRAPSGASYLPIRQEYELFAVVGVFAIAGAYGRWRTQQFSGGQIAALGMFAIMWPFMAIWWSATFYPFAHVQQSNPYWIEAWQWSTEHAHVTGESFVDWIFWDNIGAWLIGGVAMLFASIVSSGVGSALGMITTRRSAATHNS